MYATQLIHSRVIKTWERRESEAQTMILMSTADTFLLGVSGMFPSDDFILSFSHSEAVPLAQVIDVVATSAEHRPDSFGRCPPGIKWETDPAPAMGMRLEVRSQAGDHGTVTERGVRITVTRKSDNYIVLQATLPPVEALSLARAFSPT